MIGGCAGAYPPYEGFGRYCICRVDKRQRIHQADIVFADG